MIRKISALLLLIFSFPIWFISSVLIKLSSRGPFIFRQKRLGKNKKMFTMYKMRTMTENAESLKKRYLRLNEADGPVFKLKNDPRLTPVGRFLSKTGIDELPQLINVLRGEMAFVGPRPLPINEAIHIPQKYHERFSILPGITSPWVVYGAHNLKFRKWMELDLKYVDEKSTIRDIHILLLTLLLMLKNLFPKKNIEKTTKTKAA